jgi:hypothetical protein
MKRNDGKEWERKRTTEHEKKMKWEKREKKK